ncbi:MAG TPA: UDP-N-acetylglucosamine 2-epimerase (non-hydrolyzing) [Longimicrobiales bacterium]
MAARRVLVVVGTRPEGIKLAPVVAALRARGDVDARVALTGQHTSLIDQVLDVFDLGAAWDLGIMREGQDLYDVAHGCLDGLRGVVAEFRPDMILVQGDTATVFFGALVGFFERVLVGHVEAGLRSHDKWHPYPEEILRRMTGVVADVHFAPTVRARDNLLAENGDPASIHVTGNTVVDAVSRIAALPHDPADASLRAVLASGRRLVLVTAHRRESFGAPLREAFLALREIADTHEDVTLLYPVHPNPNVRGPAQELLAGHPRIVLGEPLDYLDLLHALRHAVLTITDSGGIQEEAPSFGTPVLVLRQVTERPEAVEAGVAQLVGTDRERIVSAASAILAGRVRHDAAMNPYGDGRAGERIADIVVHRLTGAPRRTDDWRP